MKFTTLLTPSSVSMSRTPFSTIPHIDCLWKQRTHYRLENMSFGFIETLKAYSLDKGCLGSVIVHFKYFENWILETVLQIHFMNIFNRKIQKFLYLM